MVTTIQLRKSVKGELERLKASNRETYEEVILKLIRLAEKEKRKQRILLKEGYSIMANESVIVNSDWEPASKEWD